MEGSACSDVPAGVLSSLPSHAAKGILLVLGNNLINRAAALTSTEPKDLAGAKHKAGKISVSAKSFYQSLAMLAKFRGLVDGKVLVPANWVEEPEWSMWADLSGVPERRAVGNAGSVSQSRRTS